MIKENEYKALYDKGNYTIEKSKIIFKYKPHIDTTVFEFSGIKYKKYLTTSNKLVFISTERDENQYYTILQIGDEFVTDPNVLDSISYKNNAQYSYRNQNENENSIAIYLKIIAWGYLFLSILIALVILSRGSSGEGFVGISLILSGIIFNAFFLGISEIIKLLAKKNK